MKAHELAEKLLENPDYDITFRIDVSTCDEDCDNRATGTEVIDVIFENYADNYTILIEGELNF